MVELKGGSSVESFDAMAAACKDAMARVDSIKHTLGTTLVDTISEEDWTKWDASQEKAIISDPVPLDSEDGLDDDGQQAA